VGRASCISISYYSVLQERITLKLLIVNMKLLKRSCNTEYETKIEEALLIKILTHNLIRKCMPMVYLFF